MPEINITVDNKIAIKADETEYICGNSDFVAKFAFDAEWEAYENKTARFCYNNSYVDVVFTGNECPVPIISGTYFFNIGVYAGNLHTTTPARVPCKKSILCGNESESSASQEVRNKFLDVLDKRTGDLGGLATENKSTIVAAINEVARSGGGGTKYQIGSGLILDAKTNTLAVDTADAVERDNTKPITSAGVYLEIGNINALLETI